MTTYRIEGREPTIFRVMKSKDNPYVMIDHRPLTNPKLSFKAKGILSYLLTRPDGWEVNVPDLVNHSTDKATAIRSGLKELRAARHMRYNPKREGGKIVKWVIEVYEVPLAFSQTEEELEVVGEGELVLDVDFLHVENLNEEKLHEENPTQLNNESNNVITSSIKRKRASTSSGKATTPKVKADPNEELKNVVWSKQDANLQALGDVFTKLFRNPLRSEYVFWLKGLKALNALHATPEALVKAMHVARRDWADKIKSPASFKTSVQKYISPNGKEGTHDNANQESDQEATTSAARAALQFRRDATRES